METQTPRQGNLSVLMKQWEQPAACTSTLHTQSQAQVQLQSQAPQAPQPHPAHPEPQVPSPGQPHPGSEPQPDMEGGPQTDADSPVSEKPSVPLTSLKMMFEKGENVANKVSRFDNELVSTMHTTLQGLETVVTV